MPDKDGAPKNSEEMASADKGRASSALLFLATAFGALTWAAAAGKFVDLVWFVDMLVKNWREFCRDVWSAVFSFLHFPYQFTPNQKDALTIIASCLAIGARPSLVGLSAKPFFKSSINIFDVDWRTTGRWSFMGKVTLAQLILMAFVMPFVDLIYFRQDVMALIVTLLGGWWIALWVSIWVLLVRKRGRVIEAYKAFDVWPLELNDLENDRRQIWLFRRFGKPITFFSILTIPILTVAVAFDEETRRPIMSYLATFSWVNVVNVLVFFGTLGALVFAARKSIRPIVYMIVAGLIVVFVGASAQQLIDSYERNFPQRVAATVGKGET